MEAKLKILLKSHFKHFGKINLKELEQKYGLDPKDLLEKEEDGHLYEVPDVEFNE